MPREDTCGPDEGYGTQTLSMHSCAGEPKGWSLHTPGSDAPDSVHGAPGAVRWTQRRSSVSSKPRARETIEQKRVSSPLRAHTSSVPRRPVHGVPTVGVVGARQVPPAAVALLVHFGKTSRSSTSNGGAPIIRVNGHASPVSPSMHSVASLQTAKGPPHASPAAPTDTHTPSPPRLLTNRQVWPSAHGDESWSMGHVSPRVPPVTKVEQVPSTHDRGLI